LFSGGRRENSVRPITDWTSRLSEECGRAPAIEAVGCVESSAIGIFSALAAVRGN
jgi:hypothetical protein